MLYTKGIYQMSDKFSRTDEHASYMAQYYLFSGAVALKSLRGPWNRAKRYD